MAEKPHMNLVTIGHVDQGKSTLIGRMLWDTGNVPEQQMKKIDEKAKELKKESFKFAFLMDTVKEERERGVTIDVMHQRFDTAKYYFTIIDAPGHRDFVKNMITGASQADAAILVLGAKDGVMPQTKEHVFLIRTLGVKSLIVAINKMDEVNFDESAYTKAKDDIIKLLKSVGFKTDDIPYIPVSAWTGENVAKKAEQMTWYKGKTMLETLDDLPMPEKPTGKPLRLPIQDVYTITGVGTVPVGRVETGEIKSGDKLVFMPSGKTGEVKKIEMHHEEIPKGEAGDNIGFNVRGLGKGDIARGEVCGHTSNPPTVVDQSGEFTAQIIVLQHPSVITKGYTPVFHIHTSHVACQITDILKKIDPTTGETKEENPDFIKPGDAAIIKCKPTKPMVIEKQSDIPQLAKFAIRDMGQTIAAGMCIDLVAKK
ncbi:MAG: translation elongation factor EF-1 subunit alpha [Candidatus Nanohalarchaeota archaeon]|nr:MAG: translation elongation factor EF-1 subunit alpha [Candidatus Nanohaloarchaeota archaeon]